jgi:hypothetical protein
MRVLVQTGYKKKFQPTPEEFGAVSRVFQRAGGSWARLFKGSVDDMTLLRKVIKVAAKRKMFSKMPKWG